MQHWLLTGRKQSAQTLAKMTMAFVDHGAEAFLTLSMDRLAQEEGEPGKIKKSNLPS